MKKILTGVMVVALLFAGSSLTAFAFDTRTNSISPIVSPTVGVCMSNAIETRDNGVIAAANAYNTSLTTALTMRKESLKSAWTNTDRVSRRNAITGAWKAFRMSRDTAKSTRNDTVGKLWDTFRNSRIACNADSDGNGSSVDRI
jgi:predicted nucleotide-binding protein (sugar kinase/HSP70/actin superfamily)